MYYVQAWFMVRVAAEHNALARLANFTFHISRAQNVPGWLQLHAQTVRSRYCRVPMFVRQRHNLLRTVCRRLGWTSVDHGGLKSTLQSQAKINWNLTPIIRSITLEQKVQCAGNARLFRLK